MGATLDEEQQVKTVTVGQPVARITAAHGIDGGI
jgi:hypothetical protein